MLSYTYVLMLASYLKADCSSSHIVGYFFEETFWFSRKVGPIPSVIVVTETDVFCAYTQPEHSFVTSET